MKPSLRFRVFQRDGYTCQYCGRSAPDVELHADHIVPRSKGGPDTLENLRTACRDCNLGKGARRLDWKWELGSGPDNAVGPLDGQTVTSPGDDTSWVPALWVFDIPGSQPDYIVGKMQTSAIMEAPHTVYLPDGHPHQSDYAKWAEIYEKCLPNRPRLLGMYLAATDWFVTRTKLAWIPAAELIFYVSGIGCTVKPDPTCYDDEWDEEASA